jgi:glycosyltransferase involved in cell wall biosynthesis
MPAESAPGGRLVIWRSALLSGSETFVRHHGDALTRWRPSYLGATRVESDLARASDLLAYPSVADRRAFLRLRLTGSSPRLRQLLAAARPDLVHAHFGGDGWLVSDAVRRLGVPLVVTVHGHDVTRQPAAGGVHGLRYRRNLRTVFARAAVIVAVSGFIRERAVACGADPAKVRVHHTGVPLPAEVPDVPKEWDVAFVGRFVEKKGAGDLLTALAALGPERPRALFIGAGPLDGVLRTRAAQLGIDATFTGARPPADVYRLLAAARVLAAPSRTARDGDTEGLPTTIVEAAALGLPVVATRHSGIPEAVVDGTTGLLGPEADPGALAGHLRRLLADDELRTRMGRAARAHAVAHFDLTTRTAELERLYDEVTTA